MPVYFSTHYMRTSLSTFFLLISVICFPQEKKIIETDSSIIEIKEGFTGSNETLEWLKSKNLVYYHYKEENGSIEKGQYDTLNRRIGLWYKYDEKGSLIRIENFDDRSYTIFKKEFYPFKSLLDRIKAQADSLVITVYGMDFFKTHARWNLRSSGFNFGGGRGSSWTDTTTLKPETFLLRYDIQLDAQLYERMIEFEMDEQGRFIGNRYEQIFGFEKLSPASSPTFVLTHEKAVFLAKQQGLLETGTTKAKAYLTWEGLKTENFYNGYYRFYVIIKTGAINNIRPEARSSITDKFDVYIFNPWTTEFIGKKKMKRVHSWEQFSGNNTGLLPDE
jgi:hypothetical protein